MSQTESTQTSGKQHKLKSSLLSPLKETFSQYTKSYRFYIPSNDGISDIVIDLSSQLTLQEAVKRTLEKASHDQPVDKNAKNYDVYEAKKSGKPQFDFPAYQSTISLDQTGSNIFCLVHVTYQEQKSKPIMRKSTADLTHYNTLEHHKEICQSPQIKQKKKKNWLLQFLGCA